MQLKNMLLFKLTFYRFSYTTNGGYSAIMLRASFFYTKPLIQLCSSSKRHDKSFIQRKGKNFLTIWKFKMKHFKVNVTFLVILFSFFALKNNHYIFIFSFLERTDCWTEIWLRVQYLQRKCAVMFYCRNAFDR